MSETDAKLEQWQSDKILDWFKTKSAGGVIGKCAQCGAREWVVGDHMVFPPTWIKDGGMLIGGIQYPMIMITCKNCGNTHFHSAVMIGLLTDDGSKKPASVDGVLDGQP